MVCCTSFHKIRQLALFLFFGSLRSHIFFYARIKWEELIGYLMNGEYYKMPVNKMLKNIIRDYSIIALAV